MKAIDKLILGTVQFGLDYGISNTKGKPTKDKIFEIFNIAFDIGIRFLDTAQVYGNAHNIIGEFHKLQPDKLFKINTKLPSGKIIDLKKLISLYIKELNVSQIETLFFHSFESFSLNKEILPELLELKRNKKIKYIGISIYENEHAKSLIDNECFDIIQLPFNLFDNIYQRGEILTRAKNNNKIIQTRSIFLQGLFFMKPNSSNLIARSLRKELIYIHEFCKFNKLKIEDLALNYVIAQDLIDFGIIGVNSPEELKANISSLSNINIVGQFFDEINQIKIKDLNLLNPSKWS
jgi:aryl-alcohol dehydrogenase-like predicted oxidoreductase